jgi:hypothetical protein
MTHKITRETIVRVAIPMSLYESVKGKVLNEEVAPADKNRRYIIASLAGTGKHVVRRVPANAPGVGKKYDTKEEAQAIADKYNKEKGLEEAKKPSAGLTKKEKSAVAKKAKAGKDIGKAGKGFEKVAAKAAKEYGSKEKGKKVAAAAMWKAQAAKKK